MSFSPPQPVLQPPHPQLQRPPADSASLVEHSRGPEVLLATWEQGEAGTVRGARQL